MKERPILFSGLMVRAILAGQKCATRRIIKPQPPSYGISPFRIAHSDDVESVGKWLWLDRREPTKTVGDPIACPYGQPGDRLWVREACYVHHAHGQHRADGERWGPWSGLPSTLSPDGTQIAYYKEGFDRSQPGRWRPSIHMPRWASRITLEIESVEVQRLQDMTEADAIEEGATTLAEDSDFMEQRYQLYLDRWHKWRLDGQVGREPVGPTKLEMFQDLWLEINGDDAWRDNPAVWVVKFRRVDQ